MYDICIGQEIDTFFWLSADMLAELSRREKAANIMPDPDIDAFMKVGQKLLCGIFTSFAEFELFAFSGGQETYVGPLGRHSSHLMKYFEVCCHDKVKAISKIL